MSLPPALLSASLLAACGLGGVPVEANDETPPSDAGAALDWPELAEVDAELTALMEDHRIPGLAACIVEGDRLAWCQGYGYADADRGLPVTSQTPFLLASVSKAVAATAVVQGHEQGVLDLDEDIDEVLPFAVSHPEAPGRAITPRMLLAHTGGIDDNWDVLDDTYVDGADSPVALLDFLESYLVPGGSRYDEVWNYTELGPGEESTYSNVGAALAAGSLEAASGQPFAAWCEQEIFAPLGMEGSAWFLSELDEDTVARPHEWRAGGFEVLDHYGFPDYPSGQLRAPAVDVARFLRAAMGGGAGPEARILGAEAQAEMLEVAWPELDPDQGLGWYRWELDGETVWGHNGGEVGASTEILWWPERDRGVVVLMNAEGRGNTLVAAERILRDAPLGG